MSRRLVAAFAFAVVALAPWAATQAWAQDRVESMPVDFTRSLVNSVSAVPPPAYRPVDAQIPVSRFEVPKPKSSSLLNSLYVSTIALQGLDMHSTMRAFKSGATEANPVMAGVAKNQTAFLMTKAAVAATTILATRHLAKRNRVAAIITLVAINSAYAMVVQHNYNVARGR